MSSVCGDRCNTYFAHLVPWVDADGSLLVALSNNAWDMVGDAYPDASLYRPSVLAIALPRRAPAPAVTGDASVTIVAEPDADRVESR